MCLSCYRGHQYCPECSEQAWVDSRRRARAKYLASEEGRLNNADRWRMDTGHHQQARVENTFHRYKLTFGRGLRARTVDGQLVEVLTGCRILNRMLELGKPESIAICA